MQAIHEEKCTALIGAPIIFRDILTHSDRKKYDLSQVEKEIPIQRIVQAYGLTESSGLLTSGLWAGDEIKVADRDGNAVPIGQQDEIWARGYPTMAGYYGDPEKIQETITPLC
ncbi:unnamed protein product [Rotaria sp. Silwood1]|nr:unnamed protein product [Rotaria sp. Silwood1]